jgi:hypothetical protein
VDQRGREDSEEDWGGQGERAKGRWGKGHREGRERGPREGQGGGLGTWGRVGRVGRGLQSHLGRAEVWSIIIGHPYLCVA